MRGGIVIRPIHKEGKSRSNAKKVRKIKVLKKRFENFFQTKMLNSVTRSLIINEFSPEEQEYWFGIKEKAVSHHIDTLYYSIFLHDDAPDIKDPNLVDLLVRLAELKEAKQSDQSADLTFYGFEVKPFGAAISAGLYSYHLAYGEDFDVFFSHYIPNEKTPRIQVQLRTRSLVLDGVEKAIQKSFDAVSSILSHFGIKVDRCQENRIDFAFHTNMIQKMFPFFNDENISEHLLTSFQEMSKHVKLTADRAEFMELDYISLGSRRSNKLFFRIYEKSKEVVQMNYKGFFFEIWRSRGLISRYDQFVYEEAYRLGSFKTGVNLGRIKWYMKYGKDPLLKERLDELRLKCDINSDNNPFMAKELKGILPPVTIILNFEFETKRKYYYDTHRSLFEGQELSEDPLAPLWHVLGQRRAILDHLTRDVVCFCDEFDPLPKPMDFWRRIQTCKIPGVPDEATLQIYYTYARNLDYQRTKKRVCDAVASLSIIKKGTFETDTFAEDFWEAINSLNDNDMVEVSSSTAFEHFLKQTSIMYSERKKKKGRQLRPIIERDKG